MNLNRVLVVEDEESHREVIRQTLQEIEGLDVVLARDGLEAFARLREEPPALVLLDMWLPLVTGMDVVRWMKAGAATQHVPIVAITAVPGAAEQAMREGCVDYLMKPFDLDHLLAKVQQHLHRGDVHHPGGDTRHGPTADLDA